MQNGRSAARRIIDGDDHGGASGGPGGMTGRGPELSDADLRAATGLYRRGAATNFVRVLSEGPLQLRRMRMAGLIETRQDVHARDTAKLTAEGLKAVLASAAEPPAR